MIRSSLEEEEQKLFINRKRKSSIDNDEEYNLQTNQMRRHDEPINDSDDSEDDEEDSDDDEIEEKDETLTNWGPDLNSRPQNLENAVPPPPQPSHQHFYDSLHSSLHVQNGSRIE